MATQTKVVENYCSPRGSETTGRPRFLQFLPTPGRGGCEEYALTVAREAIVRGWSVDAAIPSIPSTVSLHQDYTKAGAVTHTLAIGPSDHRPPQHPYVVLPRWWRAKKIINRLRPDKIQIVLPLPYYGLGPILASAKRRIPTLVVFQLVTPDCRPIGTRAARLYAWAKSREQRWVAVSGQNRSSLSTIFQIDENNLDLVYNGADNQAPTSDRAHLRSNLFSTLAWPTDTIALLSVGRLDRQKGFDLVIQAAPHVIRSFPSVRFLIAGEGTERERLEALIRQHNLVNHVRLLGHRKDVPDLLAASDLFVFPSRFEGHPFSLLEAMAAGLPVVASSASGIPEIVTDRKNGVLFQSEDACDLLENLRWAIDHHAQRMSFAATGQITASRFNKQQMLDKTFELFGCFGEPAVQSN